MPPSIACLRRSRQQSRQGTLALQTSIFIDSLVRLFPGRLCACCRQRCAGAHQPFRRLSDAFRCTYVAARSLLGQTGRMSSRQFLRFAAAFWLLFGLVAGILVWISMIQHGHNIPLLLGYYIAVWLAWLAPTALVGWLARRFPVTPPRPQAVLVHVLAATVIALLHTIYSMSLMLWLRPYDRMTASASELEVGKILLAQIPLGWILYLLVLGAWLALEYSQRYRERAIEAAELQRSLADARLHALELQIQPHFLFNTLNAISGLVRVNRKDEAVSMVAGLADLLRYSLDHAGRQRVPLGEEVEVLKRYLEIQQARFPNRMSFTLIMDDALRQAAVPTLILQPLAENAVRHGIAKIASAGIVEVHVQRTGERLEVRIRNSGTMTSALVEGIGLSNTRERLRTLYGENAHFSLKQSADSVVALLDLPLEILP
jgi:two-component system, LytTR family, sensor kinase